MDSDAKKNRLKNISSAIGGDAKLLAVCVDGTRILIYDVDKRELVQELDGTGKIFFALSSSMKEESVENEVRGAEYMLVSGVSDIGDPRKQPSKLILREMDKNGRLLDADEPVDTALFATKAIESIACQLEEQHEWSKEFFASSTLQADFDKALHRVAADHRRRHFTPIEAAHLSSYGKPFSSDRKFMLFLRNDGDRRSQPTIVVWDVDACKENLVLTGHTDVSSLSPSNLY